MRPLELNDFKATGWDTGNASVLATINGILATQGEAFSKYGITKGIHVAYMMGQFAHESGEGQEMTESLNYRPSVLLSQWGNHFSAAQAMQYGRTADHPANQKMIADLAYGGRMGNAPAPSDDGMNFRGRGLIQTTGKEGYALLAKESGIDLLTHPELINDPKDCFILAVCEFVNYPHMLALCEAGNINQITREINGGLIGLADRIAQTQLWKHQYGV